MSRAAELPKLAMLRESLMQGAPAQNHIGMWWAGLLTSDRRTLLALSGLDDEEKSAKRPWMQFLPADRESLLAQCAHLVRILKPVEWA